MGTTHIDAVEHVSPRVVRIDFSFPMRNDALLRDVNMYTVDSDPPGTSATILSVVLPTAQNQPYFGPVPLANGGAPLSVYLVCAEDLYALLGASGDVTVANALADPSISPVDYDGSTLDSPPSPATHAVTFLQALPVTYWNADGIRKRESFDEFSRTGAKFTSEQDTNYGVAMMLGKIADIVSGGQLGKLAGAIDGPLEGALALPYTEMGSGGFTTPTAGIPGVGDPLTFADLNNDSIGDIPYHVDKLWGKCDGVNTLFRTSIPYHPFECVVIRVPNPSDETDTSETLTLSEWFAPTSGTDRLLKTVTAPAAGSTLLAIYVPRQSIVRIDHEIISYTNSNIYTGAATIAGRANLCTTLEAHAVDAIIEDVWATSFVKRAEYSLFAFGAHGRALEIVARDLGAPRADNPSLTDTELRRYIFNTAVTQRATPVTVVRMVRYLYPDLWPYILVDEDPRWPNALVIWYSSTVQIGETSLVTQPPVELWETWLDHVALMDGFPLDLYGETYLHDPVTDTTYDGDYLLTGASEDPELAPYPVILSGPAVSLIGEPAPVIPVPASVSDEYLNYLVRPAALDRALSAGVGVLILDIDKDT